MTDQHERKVNILAFAQRPIAYYPIFARIGGSVTAGIFLSQLFYWSDKGKLKNGWIWKTQEEWTKETCLSRHEQEHARKTLRGLRLLQEKREGIPARLYYRLDLARLVELCEAECPSSADLSAGKWQTGLPESGKQDPAFSHTTSETTTETTSENTHPEGVRASPPPETTSGIATEPGRSGGEEANVPTTCVPPLPEHSEPDNDEPDPPDPGSREGESETVALDPLWLPALARACREDPQHVPKTWRTKAVAFAKRLAAQGLTPREIARWYGPGGWWDAHDWRGKQGDPPKLEQILETVGKASFAQKQEDRHYAAQRRLWNVQ